MTQDITKPISVPTESRQHDSLNVVTGILRKIAQSSDCGCDCQTSDCCVIVNQFCPACLAKSALTILAASSSLLPVGRQLPEYSGEIKNLISRCEYGVETFSNDDMSAALVEIDRLRRVASLPVGESRQQIDKAFEGMSTDEVYQRESARLQGESTRPKIVCLCGSTRFYEHFQRANYDETMLGNIVLSVGFYPHARKEMHHEEAGCTPEQKIALDELHKRKIDLADEVLVLNVGGYIGSSTRSEIDYAEAHGKPVRYLLEIEVGPGESRDPLPIPISTPLAERDCTICGKQLKNCKCPSVPAEIESRPSYERLMMFFRLLQDSDVNLEYLRELAQNEKARLSTPTQEKP